MAPRPPITSKLGFVLKDSISRALMRLAVTCIGAIGLYFYAGLLPAVAVFAGGLFLAQAAGRGPVCEATTDLTGKTIIVTGANTGIGRETAQMLTHMGGEGTRVILACRSLSKAAGAVEYCLEGAPRGVVVEARPLDLSDLASVASFAESVAKDGYQISVLVNNAGVMMCPYQTTAQGIEWQHGVNHLGHFYLVTLLMDNLASNDAKVVNLSSMGYLGAKGMHMKRNGDPKTYNKPLAYAASKLANIWFTRTLNRAFAQRKNCTASAYAVHPGAVRTELMRHNGLVHQLTYPIQLFVGKSPRGGAMTTIFCVCDPRAEPGELHADCTACGVMDYAADDERADAMWTSSIELCESNEFPVPESARL